jgi:LysM repeat protein
VIETVYSNESGDTGRTNKAPNSFKMPKNIRQVGKSNAIKKIYVEDYVMTFIKQLAGGDFSGCKIAVLTGQSIKLENCRNIFISGAVEVRDLDTSGEIVFSNDIWNGIYEEIKKYFVEAEIVGWFIGGPGYLLEDEDKILKIHLDNFAGQDKTLLAYDNMEREEAFYSFENNRLCRQEGYYIYYEKNEEMQAYMIDHKKEQSGEANYDDRVSRDIRTVLQNKKPSEEDNKNVTRLMYAAGTLLAVIILVVGAAILSNYDQMKSMKSTMDYLSRNMEEIQEIFTENGLSKTAQVNNASGTESSGTPDSTETGDSSEESLNVEVMPGDVEPLEGADTRDGAASDQTAESDNDDTEISDEELADDTADDGKAQDGDADSQEGTQTAQDETKYYTVVSGDTLAGISYKLYNTYTKVKKIMELNNIEDQNFIYIGQKLIVP